MLGTQLIVVGAPPEPAQWLWWVAIGSWLLAVPRCFIYVALVAWSGIFFAMVRSWVQALSAPAVAVRPS